MVALFHVTSAAAGASSDSLRMVCRWVRWPYNYMTDQSFSGGWLSDR